MPYSEPNNALIIVDVQNDFLPGGALAVPNGDQIIPQITRLAGEHHYVLATQDWHPPDHFSFSENPEYRDGSWPVHCVSDTHGAALDTRLPNTDAVFRKGMFKQEEAYSGFDGFKVQPPTVVTRLHAFLAGRKVKKVTVVGLALDYCVRATALDAIRYGYQTTVALRATRPVDDNQTAGVLMELEEAGVRLDK